MKITHPAATPEPTGKRPPASLPHALHPGEPHLAVLHTEQCTRGAGFVPGPDQAGLVKGKMTARGTRQGPETGPGPWIPTAQGTFHIVHRGAMPSGGAAHTRSGTSASCRGTALTRSTKPPNTAHLVVPCLRLPTLVNDGSATTVHACVTGCLRCHPTSAAQSAHNRPHWKRHSA